MTVAVGLQSSGYGDAFSNEQVDGGVGANLDLDPVERARQRGRPWPMMARGGSGVLPRRRHEWMASEHLPRVWPSDLGKGLRAKVRDLLATMGPEDRLQQQVLDLFLDEAHGELNDFCLAHDRLAEKVHARRVVNGNDSLWGLGLTSIYRAVRGLAEAGWISRRYRRLPGAGARVITEFRIHIAPHAQARWYELLRLRREAKDKNRGKGGRTTPPKNPGDRPRVPEAQPDGPPAPGRLRPQDNAAAARGTRAVLKGKGWRARDG